MKKTIVTKNKFIGTYRSMKYANEALSKYGHLLPINPSPELAKIVASLITDGSIDVRLRYKSYYYGYIQFFSKNNGELINFGEHIFNLFKIKGKIKDWGIREIGIRYSYIILNSFLSRALTLCGVPGGSKVKKAFSVPSWLMKGDKYVKASFLRASFDGEGSIRYSSNRKRWEIAYCMFKLSGLKEDCINYMNQIRGLLHKFEIDSILYKKEEYASKRYGKTVYGYNIRIDKNESVLNYAKNIGFENKDKKKRLVQAVTDINSRNIYK